MSINLKLPDIKELKPKITVFGVGGAGGNAVNNMIRSGLEGCEFVVANTDSQALMSSRAERRIQMGVGATQGLGAGSQPQIGRAAAEEVLDEITDHLTGAHMIFVTAGMGGGTGTGAAPVIARAAREAGILTVGVVTKPFQFEGARRMRVAEAGIADLQDNVDTLIVIPNQNLFRIANEKTTFADAFAMADQVLFSGVACITDLMVKEGLINLDFADVRSVMREMGKAMMGTGEASGSGRAQQAAEAAIANPLLDETSMRGAKGLLISITGGRDLTLFEVDEAATRIREEVDPDANIILGATFDESMEGVIRVSVVATGIDSEVSEAARRADQRIAELSRPARPVSPPIASRASEAAKPLTAALRAAAPAPQHTGSAPQPPAPTPSAHTETALAEPIAHAEPRPAATDPGVTIGPYNGYGSAYANREPEDHHAPMEAAPLPASEPFIPPQPEIPPARVVRSEDLPPHVQRQLAPRAPEEDRGPRGLISRLTKGLGRREEAAPEPERQAPRPMPRPAAPAAAPTRLAQAPGLHRPVGPNLEHGRRPADPIGQRPASDGLYRPRQGDLDPHGRSIPRDARQDDGELEIPAFLRRQAN